MSVKDTQPLILGIESTCDETGVALIRGRELLVDTVASSMDEHARYGGIIPEIASRAHLDAFLPTLHQSLDAAEVGLGDVDAIAVSAGPGLIGSLTVGVSAAKALALATGKPLYGVNHVVGHALVDQLVDGDFPDDVLALAVSGGHTSLLRIRGIRIEEIGSTLDDAAGEAFDKIGRLLGLPYPGGPHIDRLAQQGNPDAVRFPRGLTRRQDMEKHRYDFSFSGVKTAVARWIEERQDRGEEINLPDVSASFSEAVSDVLTYKSLLACKDLGIETFVLGGGFSANSQLRAKTEDVLAGEGIDVRIPPLKYCTDNGAMIAMAGLVAYENELPPSGLDFGVDSALSLSTLLI